MKILFVDSIQTFTNDIITELGKEHNVIITPNKYLTNPIPIIEGENPDIVWFEWCNEPLIISSQHQKKNYKVINRLHSYELFHPSYIHTVKWDYVDDLIFVAAHTKNIFDANTKLNKTKTHVIHNGVRLDKFIFNKDKHYGNSLAFVGDLNHKKNIPLILQCYDAIKEFDEGYSLHIAGEWKDLRIQLACMDFINKRELKDIHFYGKVNDIPAWLKDKDFILSTSPFESFHYGAMEGIACGCLPLIYHWYGAEKLYPRISLFLNIYDFLEAINFYKDRDHMQRVGIKNYKEVEKRFSFEVQMKQIKDLINSYEVK